MPLVVFNGGGARVVFGVSDRRPRAQDSPLRIGPALLQGKTRGASLRQRRRVHIDELELVNGVRPDIVPFYYPRRSQPLLQAGGPLIHRRDRVIRHGEAKTRRRGSIRNW